MNNKTVLYNIITQKVLSIHDKGYYVDGKKSELPSNIVELAFIENERPAYDITKNVEETFTVDLEAKTFTQSYTVTDKTEEQIHADKLSQSSEITATQLKVQLALEDITDTQIYGVIDNLELEDQRIKARIGYDYGNTFKRDNALVNLVSSAFGKTEKEMDDIFIAAKQIEI